MLSGTRDASILLVEDEPETSMYFRRVLQKNGYSVMVAETGEQAVELAAAADEEGRPDLVLMDIELGPGIDGVQAARQILSEQELPFVFHCFPRRKGVVCK